MNKLHALLILLSLTFMPITLYGGKPDKRLHEKCIYPTVMLIGRTGMASGVILKSFKEDEKYVNIVATCAHVLHLSPPIYRKIEGEVEEGDSYVELPDGTTQKVEIIEPSKYEYKVRFGNYKNWSMLESVTDYKCEVVAKDTDKDVALIKFISDKEMPTVDLDFSPELYIGNDLCRVGCGIGEYFKIDFGKVTGLDTNVGRGENAKGTYRTSVPSVPGDSGGPVFHNYKMVGITQSVRGITPNPFSKSYVYHISYVIPLQRFAGSDIIKDYLKKHEELKDLVQDQCEKNPPPEKELPDSASSSDS